MSSLGNGPDNPDVILHIGAGTCSELDEWLSTGAKRVVLVEPNPECARALAANVGDDGRIEVVQKAVVAESGQRRLKLFNLRSLSSVREPTGLLDLFPGLRTEREFEVDAITPGELIEIAGLVSNSDQWLIIDTPGEEAAIVNALHSAGDLAHFNRVILHCGTESLYTGNTSAAALLDDLREAGYDIEQQDDREPDRPRWSLQRNHYRLENQALRQELAALKKQVQEAEEGRLRAERDRDTYLAQVEVLGEVKTFLEGHVNRVESISNANADALEKVRSDIEESMSVASEVSMRQIEAYIGLSDLWTSGELLPALHDWAICPDLAMHLTREIYSQNYDLIIEFGSGQSTAIMARALKEKENARNVKAKTSPATGSVEETSPASDGHQTPRENFADESMFPSVYDAKSGRSDSLDGRIVSFEHISSCKSDSERALARAGVSEVAEVLLAPLQQYTDAEGVHYLHYDCGDTLHARRASLATGQRHVLLVIDGPPGKTNKEARYPALPKVLEHFANDRLCVVMDDTNRDDEKAIIQHWEKDLRQRGLQYEKKRLKLKKGAVVLRIN